MSKNSFDYNSIVGSKNDLRFHPWPQKNAVAANRGASRSVPYLSTPKVAKQLGITTWQVRGLVEAGKLHPDKVNGKLHYKPSEVDALKREREGTKSEQ